MAYTTKWFSEFADESGDNIYCVEVLDRDFSGESAKIISGGVPVRVQMMDVKDPFQVIRSLKFTFQWISDEVSGFDISDLFITDDRKYKFRFSQYDGDEKILLYTGYLVFIDCEEPFRGKPYPVTLSGTCSLPLVRDDYFLDGFGSFTEGKISLIKIIANCLSSTGLQLPIHTFIDLYESGMTYGSRSALDWAEIDADGLRGKKGGDILEGILGAFNAFIVQSHGAWVIKGVREQEAYLGHERRFDHTGNFIGYSVVNQVTSFGRTAVSEGIPTIRPILNVKEFFAEPNSIASVNVSPGIPVNRLPNGSFSGPILGGNLQGWNSNLSLLQPGREGAGWTRSGIGSPGDPYKMDMTGAVVTPNYTSFPRVGMSSIGYIEFNTGPFLSGKVLEYPKFKVVISGAYRSSDISFFQLFVRLNEGDREYVSYLNENGEWSISKRARDAKYVRITPSLPVAIPVSNDFDESILQTFEIETDIITNYLDRSGQNVSRLYFDVKAAQVLANNVGELRDINPRLTWEDFSVTVTTETVFEGEHKYKFDAKFPIRNPTEAEHTIIIADKIGIDTPEQKRPENRVMTGYMTLQGGNTLTTGWKRFVGGVSDSRDPDHDPIQKKCLRERVRLYCGKRAIIEGPFKGIGLLPHHSVINRYITEDKFYSVLSWEWSPKEMVYDASFFELNFDALDNEVIDIVGDEEGRRGNRMYSGGGGSVQSISPTTAKPIEEIVIDEIEPYEYEILVEDEEDRICDVAELIVSTHTADLLEAKILYFPPWIKEISVYQGGDIPEEDLPEGGVLQVLWQGKPEKSGGYQILVELTAATGADYTLSIPIAVEPSDDFAETWPPVFTDLPDMYFTINKESSSEILLSDYMDEEHAFAIGYSYRILDKPTWVSEHTIIFQNLAVTAKPTTLETRRLLIEIKDSIGRKDLITVNLVVLPAPKHTYTIMDTDLVSIVGEVPGSYELPAKWDFRSKVEGKHNQIVRTLKGGGPLNAELNISKDEEVTETDLATYRMFQDTDGVITEAGQFVYTEELYLGTRLVSSNTVDFVLYDEEYLAKLKAFLTVAGVSVGEISPDGSTVFDNYESWNSVFDLSDVEHDEVILTMGEHTKTYTLEELAVSGSYPLFEEDRALPHGVYSIAVITKLTGVEVLKRSYTFEISKQDPKPEAGFELVSHKPSTINYSVVGDIPETGFIFDLPDAYGVMFQPDIEISSFEWKYYKLEGGGFTEINLEALTGYPQKITFSEPVVNEKILIFGGKKSTQITGIHEVGRFRADGIARDATGKIVQLVKADWSFRLKLAEEDYSGLEMWYDSLEDILVDSDMPRLGATYEIPELPHVWSVRFKRFKSGAFFDKVTLVLKRNGVTLGHRGPGDEFVAYIEHDEPTDKENLVYVWGTQIGGSDKRSLIIYPSGGWDNIDEPDVYEVSVKGYLNDIEVASTSSIFNLIYAAPEPEIKDCCCDGDDEGSGELEYLFSTPAEEWIINHGLNRMPIPNIIIGGKMVMSDVIYIDNDVLKIVHSKPRTGIVTIK